MARNIAHSIKARLFNISDHDNRRYQQLLVRYMQERFLYRLSVSKYCDNFVLKGGALLYAYDEFLPRPTLDVDFMGKHISNDKASIVDAFREILYESDDDGVLFLPESIDVTDIAVERKYPGVRITVVGVLDTVKKELTFDIGFGDVIIPQPVMIYYPTIIGEMDAPRLATYSLETVVAEKLQTIVEKSIFNSRMKDFFDLYRILSAHRFDETIILKAIRATFDNRHTNYADIDLILTDEFANDYTLNQRWTAFCHKTRINTFLSFVETMCVISDFIKPLKEKL